jgi:hypothetical protein
VGRHQPFRCTAAGGVSAMSVGRVAVLMRVLLR